MWISIDDGRTLSVPLACIPQFLNATSDQLRKVQVSPMSPGLT